MTSTSPEHQDDGYRDELLSAYDERIEKLDRSRADKLEWFQWYAKENYRELLPPPTSDPAITDVGCSRGYLLEVLAGAGYRRLSGVDASPTDLGEARRQLPECDLEVGRAHTYFTAHPDEFDVVILRAIVEHIPKGEVMSLLAAANRSLCPNGMVIVDVPNMDWLFAGHERYMDFTHEVGFTSDSLAQVMGTTFDRVQVTPVDHRRPDVRGDWRSRVGRAILGRLLRWSDPEGAQNSIWSRNIIGVGYKR